MSEVKINWPEFRLAQFDMMVELIREVSAMNRANCILERMKKCIELADRLDRFDMDLRKSSFVQFLKDLAYERVEEPKSAKKNRP